MTCKNCKWSYGNEEPMYCERHAPIVIANPNYSNRESRTTVKDSRITLTEQPKVYGDCRCGDFEPKEKEND